MAVCFRKSKHLLAKIANKCAPCAFCKRQVDDELIYGKLYAIGDLHVHYFCVLLSCCLIQKGKDEEGLFGFLYPDILAEIERSKKHRCSYCNQEGAALGCAISQCRKQFHLPCGREKDAISMFHGNYKSFCRQHAPKQKVTDNILEKIKERRMKGRKIKTEPDTVEIKSEDVQEMVCVICYEAVDAFPSLQTFWPPCCARDAWFHRKCLQRMSLSAGMHFLKCPLCNDKKQFYDALMSQGYYIPDRDAAWELEQNAFDCMYERAIVCNASYCKCPQGRDYDLDNSPWDIKLCLLCGSVGPHADCADAVSDIYVCSVCLPAAPDDPTYLEAINKLALPESNQTMSRAIQGPVMPSRMSLRRTKPMLKRNNAPSNSNIDNHHMQISETDSQNTPLSRHDLNLKTPIRGKFQTRYKSIENKLQSPLKMLEQKLYEKLEDMEALDSFAWDSSEVIDVIREKIRKPRPLAVKKKIVNTIIDNVLNNILKERIKVKEPVPEMVSPKKSCDIDDETSQKIYVDLTQDVQQEIYNETLITEYQNTTHIKDENKLDVSNIISQEFPDKNLPIVSPKSNPVIVNNDSAMEISKNNQKLDINVVKVASNEKDKKISLKFSPCKEVLGRNLDIDMESFKNQYLNEVGRDSEIGKKEIEFAEPEGGNLNKCLKNRENSKQIPRILLKVEENSEPEERKSYKRLKNRENSKHSSKSEHSSRHEIDINETKSLKSNNCSKKRKATDNKRESKGKNSKIQKRSRTSTTQQLKKRNLSVVVEMSDNVRRKKKDVKRRKDRQNELSIRDKNIHVNIRWKKEKLKLKITKSKEEKKVLKQYILQCAPECSSNVLVRPDTEIACIRKKPIKTENKPDNLIQTSISNFFKVKTPEK